MTDIKKTSARIRKADEKSKSKGSGGGISGWLGFGKEGNFFGSLGNIFKVIGAIAVIAFAYVISKQSQTAIRNLINADDAVLKDAIFGEVPHVFFCDRGTPGNPSPVPPIFSELNLQRGNKMGFAVLNCSQILPSGKSIWDRFKLKREWKPAVWGVAPWSKPLQAGPAHMKDINTLKKFIDDSFAPRATEVKSDKQLVKFCSFDKNKVKRADDMSDTCFLLSRGSRHGKSHQDLEQRLILAYPRVKFAWADASKLRMSYENVEDTPHDAFPVRLHALRNNTHYMTMVHPVTWDYMNTFVSQAIASGLTDFQGDKRQLVKLTSPATLTKQTTSKKDKKKTTPKKHTPAEPTVTDGFDDGNRKMSSEERKERRDRARAQAAERPEEKEGEASEKEEKTVEDEAAA
ncbi:hypothetical protein EON65_38995, partial [archaeon]